MSSDEYRKVVEKSEEGLETYAKRSFEPFSSLFIDGGEIYAHYADQWSDPETRPRIAFRTPVQVERDRVLYSNGMRKLTEKYHVLYSGDRRFTRNFTTHTMRMAQVARAISQGLVLNADFAEAIALGAKVGAPPFVHASKSVVVNWIIAKINKLQEAESGVGSAKRQGKLFSTEAQLPTWMANITSDRIAAGVNKFIPWAAGEDLKPYSSGSEGYWTLAADPYLVKSRPNRFSPELMFGIWMHGLADAYGPQSFEHRFAIEGATNKEHFISWSHVTYESLVVRYADDITWVIENLDDGHKASIMAGRDDIYSAIFDSLREGNKIPPALSNSLLDKDSGSLYNYFISDFIQNSKSILQSLSGGREYRQSLRHGETNALVSLSARAMNHLDKMKAFLEKKVFREPRVANRFLILETLTAASLDLLYESDRLNERVKLQAAIMNIKGEKLEETLDLLKEPVHRIQLVVDMFSQMSDQEIYDFVGIQGL
jgi:dGTP triphosphohydrolase